MCVSFDILSTASFRYSELSFSKNYNNYETVKVLRPYYIAVQTSDYKFFEKTMHILKLRPVLTSKIKSIKELGQECIEKTFLPTFRYSEKNFITF